MFVGNIIVYAKHYNLFVFLVEKTIDCIIMRNITEDCIFISRKLLKNK